MNTALAEPNFPAVEIIAMGNENDNIGSYALEANEASEASEAKQIGYGAIAEGMGADPSLSMYDSK